MKKLLNYKDWISNCIKVIKRKMNFMAYDKIKEQITRKEHTQ